MKHAVVLFALTTLLTPVHGQERIVRKFSVEERHVAFNPRYFLLSPEVVDDPKDGSIRLAHSVLVTDEMGATDHHQGEALSATVWVRKVFLLDSAEVGDVELFLFGRASKIAVNGNPLTTSEKLASTGFSRARVPATYLKQGENEVLFSDGGSLLIDPSRPSGRSFKSTNAGKTWSNQSLGGKNNLQGEYLVRLRLGRYARHGSVQTQVIDLWSRLPGDVAVPGKLVSFQAPNELQRGQPAGTKLAAALRTGSTPQHDVRSWTDWILLDQDYRPAEGASRHRWAQLKFELTSDKAQVTPRLPSSFDIAYRVEPSSASAPGKLAIDTPSPPLVRGSIPFVYQEPSPRLTLLRERYQLDQVIASGKTEMEQLMLLRHWVRNQWHTGWEGGPASWMPPWDALMILESKDQPDCLTMCTHYAAVYTQCCLALGWNARHCILDHHCVSEVFVNQHAKWVMMDTGNSKERPDANLHFERNGVPLSARELHEAYRDKKTDGITVHFTPAKLMAQLAERVRPAPATKSRAKEGKVKADTPRPDSIPVDELPKYPVCGVANFRRYGFPERNNYLSSLFPGELYQGWSSYFYDGYCWIGDSAEAPKISPEYSRHRSPSRPQDVDWPLNVSRIHLARTAEPGTLHVDLETLTPNLLRLEKRDGDDWKPTPPSFGWKLQPGANVLKVRSVNRFQRPGIESTVQVMWTKE